jgi:ATP-binding cassette subfamily B protein
VRPYKKVIAGTLLALLVAAAAQLAVGVAVRNIVDGDLPARDSPLLLVLAGVGVIFAAATYCRVNLVSWLGERVAADARNKVFSHVVGLGSDFFDRNKTNEILSRLVADTSVLQTLVVSTAPSGLHDLVLLGGSASLMIVTSPRLAGVVLGAVPVLVLPAFLLGKRVRKLSRASQDELAEVNSVAGESLGAITTVQAFNHEQIDRERVARRVEAAFAAARRRFQTEALLSTLTVLLIFGLITVVLWTGARDLGAGRMTAGELTAFLIYALLAASSFGSLTAFWAQLQRAAGAAERLGALLKEEPSIVPPAEPAALPDGPGRISFRNVTFRYPSRPDSPALRNFSLEVEPGQTIALVGPSGAGKSTVFNLLLRFYDPQEGVILLDGVDLKSCDPRAVRSRMGLVSQEPAIFNATVAENIRYGRPGASDDEVWEAAEAAAVTEFLDSLPQGFATPLGERGARLSGGQRQRLAIARALVRDPSGILLLDEATSALDSASERTIQQALEAATSNRTSLVIAHRLATVRMADRIIVMDRGRIVGDGTHENLIRDNGLYAELARLQFAAQPDGVPEAPVPILRWPAVRPAPLLPDFAAPWDRSGHGGAALPGWESDAESAAEGPGATP